MLKGNKNNPVAIMFSRMLKHAPDILARDTPQANFTRFLPPTPSMPDAVFDPEAFLGQ